jgi:DNA-binding response OmpR family regulator
LAVWGPRHGCFGTVEQTWHRRAAIPRILLAEEDHEIRALWNTVLDRAGYEVMVCPSRAEFEQMVDRLVGDRSAPVIDLVVCDARMLDDTLRRRVARLQRATQFPTLVVIAAYRGKQLLAQMSGLDIEAVFDQPFRIREQLATVRSLISRNLAAGEKGLSE